MTINERWPNVVILLMMVKRNSFRIPYHFNPNPNPNLNHNLNPNPYNSNPNPNKNGRVF